MRSGDFFEARSERLEAQVREIEQRLDQLRSEEAERITGFEEKLLQDSERRIHDFERRLEHEWLALRHLHEESLKSVEQRTIDIAGSCVSVVQEALAVLRSRDADPASVPALPQETPSPSRWPTILLAAALVAITGLAGYTTWRLNRDLQGISARAAAAESRLVQLQQFVERNAREAGDTAQRVGAAALAASAKAERLASVLAAPDVGVYPMRGQIAGAAPAGQVFSSPSRGIAMSASRLPRVAANQTYQVWMTTTRGPISLGLVEPDAQGRMDATFETPAETAGNVIGFMLTVEPSGGSERPSGPIAIAS